MYLGWSGSEAGKALVVTDLQGTVLWRQSAAVFGGANSWRWTAASPMCWIRQENYVIESVETGTANMYPGPGRQHLGGRDQAACGRRIVGETGVPGGMDARNGKLYLTVGKDADGRCSQST